ncbi:MAG: hypothetical protein L0332_09460 [Chloroflexi bacterium]|nr:hypothetical protein [Chloroflexota bacterium]MCI0579859.1 hypothetical protein [Chloroflexota bacterium]MCI0643259.1 hypothetical protein [Chloroflexota bacterium]MCI0726933.1 hypothetical protein [Chloroflexota bacterium]
MNAKRIVAGLVLVFLLAAVVSLPILAQSGGGFDLSWNSLDGGGATFSSGGGYSLGGTIGQADAGPAGGGAYTLEGGFWGGAEPAAPPTPDNTLYLPLIRR